MISRKQLGINFFGRGEDEVFTKNIKYKYSLSLYNLTKSYTNILEKEKVSSMRIAYSKFFTVEQALKNLKDIILSVKSWQSISYFIPKEIKNYLEYKAAYASYFVATLELSKAGKLNIKENKKINNLEIILTNLDWEGPLGLHQATLANILTETTCSNIFMNTKSEITEELKSKIIEAYIFASKDPVHISKLQFFENNKSNLLKIIKKLQNKYITSGINLINIENSFAFRTSEEVSELLNFEQEIKKPLSRAASETLAIIAYHQPITRAKIENISNYSKMFKSDYLL